MSNIKKQEGLLSGFGTSIAFSGVLTGGFGSVSAIKRNKGIVNAINQTRNSNQVVSNILKNTNADSFTKAYAAAKNYDKYSSAVKSAANAKKQLEKIAKNGGQATLWQRIKNFGKNTDAIKQKYNASSISLDTYTKKLKNGEEILEETLSDGTKIGTNVLSSSLGANTKALFKEELLNPINLIYALTSTIGRIKSDAIPVFKEQGAVAGLKETGKAILKSAADVFSNAGFSAVFRILGSRIGYALGKGAGASVLGTIGDIFGTFLSNKLITKVFKEDKKFTNNAIDTSTEASRTDFKTNDTNETKAQETSFEQNSKIIYTNNPTDSYNEEKIKKALYA